MSKTLAKSLFVSTTMVLCGEVVSDSVRRGVDGDMGYRHRIIFMKVGSEKGCLLKQFNEP